MVVRVSHGSWVANQPTNPRLLFFDGVPNGADANRSRGERAVILFTVLPQDQETAALDFMKRQLSDFRGYVMENSRMMRVPYFEVRIDSGEKNRQHIDEISNEVFKDDPLLKISKE